MASEAQHILYFDGICNVCHASVRFVLRWDKAGIFHFASLQSDFARNRLQKLEMDAAAVDTVVYQRGVQMFSRSDAVLEVLHDLGGIWRGLYVLKIIPASWRNFVYTFFAARRYRWFGRKDVCPLPAKDVSYRFLD